VNKAHKEIKVELEHEVLLGREVIKASQEMLDLMGHLGREVHLEKEDHLVPLDLLDKPWSQSSASLEYRANVVKKVLLEKMVPRVYLENLVLLVLQEFVDCRALLGLQVQ